ncbi:MAG: DUF4129 domain-containing protein [Anaerolineae bacterium]|jgi:hypothetical protein
MIQRNRFWFVVSAVVATAAIVILVSGVSTVDLDYEGHGLPSLPREGMRQDGSAPVSHVLEPALRVFFMVGGALLPFAIIFYLVSPEGRERALRDLIALLIILLPLYLLWRAQPDAFGAIGDVTLPQTTSEDLPPAPDIGPEPRPTQWLIVVATVVVALVGAALIAAVARAIWRRRQRPSTSLDQLAEQAQDAIDAIEAGADLKDTVTRCYFEMVQVLREERGIQRQRAMTPREFEARLEEAGIPTAQVRRLTRLFEEVRYGDKSLGDEEERQAVISLTSIVRFCRSAS